MALHPMQLLEIKMKSDNAPSILVLAYGKPEKLDKFEREFNQELREFRMYDLALKPERANEIINKIKHFTWKEYAQTRSPFRFLNKQPFKWLFKKFFGYAPMDISKFEDWERDSHHELNSVMLFPTAMQYAENNPQWSAEEQKLFDDILNFKTKEYKPVQHCLTDEDFNHLNQSNKQRLEGDKQ